MANYNRVILAGNLTKDPELRFVEVEGEGVPVCSFGLAVNRVRSRSEEVDFFDISAWRELGETIANYKKKGDPILVEVHPYRADARLTRPERSSGGNTPNPDYSRE
jgi:single-strand DNA-binding protein